MKLQQMLRNEVSRLQAEGKRAIKILGFVDAEDAWKRADEEREFLVETQGSVTRRRGYEKVNLFMTDEPDAALWFPAGIAARMRCLDTVDAWIYPFRILSEMDGDDDFAGWEWIDRAIAALRDDLHRAAPSPDPKAFRAWRGDEERKEVEAREGRAARISLLKENGPAKPIPAGPNAD